jgi:hypothetical protein
VEFGVTAARYLLLLDRWDDALATVAALGDEVRRVEIPVIERDLCAVRVAADVARGRPVAATAEAARYEELLPATVGDRAPLGHVAVAVVRLALGERERATGLLEEAADIGFISEPADVLWWPVAVRTALALEQPSLAERLTEAALTWPACPARVRSSLTALRAQREGRLDAAGDEYSAAAAAWRACKSPSEEGLALCGLSECLLALHRATEAASALGKAQVLFETIDSRPGLAAVALLRQGL